MARALTLGVALVVAGGCTFPQPPPGLCLADGGCRAGYVCRFDGTCAMTECNAGESVACVDGPYVSLRACADGRLGSCRRVLCANQEGACAGAQLLRSEADSGCGPLSYAAGNASWQDRDTCDGIDNDCDGDIDEYDPPDGGSDRSCPLQAGVCAGAQRRCGDESDCSPQTYQLHAGDAGFQELETQCDGVDNDCDGIVDVSSERLIEAGASETVLVVETHAAGRAYRAVTLVGTDIVTRTLSSRLGTAVDREVIASVSPTGPAPLVAAAQNAEGTFIAWRIDGGIAAHQIRTDGTPRPRGAIQTPVTFGPRVLAPSGNGNGLLLWTTPLDLRIGTLRPEISWRLPTSACGDPTQAACISFFPNIQYLDATPGEAAGITFGIPLNDGGTGLDHIIAELIPMPAACAATAGYVDVGPACARPLLLPNETALGAAPAARAVWLSAARLPPAFDLRVLAGNQPNFNQRHSFGIVGHPDSGYPVTDVNMPFADEGVLSLTRGRDGGAGRAWFVQRSGSLVLAQAEVKFAPFIELTDAGHGAPTAAWNPATDHVAVAYPVDRPDGGTDVVGRLLCRPR